MSSYKPQVLIKGETEFSDNALSFATYEEAYKNAFDLASRWMSVNKFRAVESNEPVTHKYEDGVLKYVTNSKE